ncbi:MAG TPA: hypothetical protein PLP33_27215 [Leptospiraceae bacterium]|nr:hypothetical protein [Leptospiraceae bacterium]
MGQTITEKNNKNSNIYFYIGGGGLYLEVLINTAKEVPSKNKKKIKF